MKKKSIREFLVRPEATIRAAIRCIECNAKGIALVVDENRRLLGTVTDGDIRGAVLAGRDLDSPITALLEAKAGTQYSRPVTALSSTGRSELLRLMQQHVVRQIPLLDEGGRVVDLATLDELVPVDGPQVQALIMAGGAGTRLRPLTDQLPKPMLPVGGRPVMARIIDQLKAAGISQVNVATHYLSDKIRDYFGNGTEFGVELQYVDEEQPLGTAGALGLMKPPVQPLLVINGDVVTEVNFLAMLTFHREHKATATVGVRKFDLSVPYGLVETEGPLLRELAEKPTLSFFINAGIYLLEPDACRQVPSGRRFEMTDLIRLLLTQQKKVASFPIHEYWLDIGAQTDYLRAQQDAEGGKLGT